MYKPTILIIAFISLIVAIGTYLWRDKTPMDSVENNYSIDQTESKDEDGGALEQSVETEVMADNLEIPWGVAFLPDGSFLVTERPGNLIRIISNSKETIPISGVTHRGEGGLLGIALHPEFENNKYLYLYLTAANGNELTNRVERYEFDMGQNSLSERKEIIIDIPGSSNHDGGRIAFSPDRFLYVATGDAGRENLSQDTGSLAGKILRLNDDGSIPDDNPFGNAVYSFGHRNVQGLTWDDEGRLWATEHGRSGILSGYDELNLIEKGKNYGWPTIQGDETRSGMEKSVIHSGPNDTWAPSGAVYSKGSIFFAGLRGQALYEYKISEQKLITHLKNEFGRLRDIARSPDGKLYFITSNTDGRGTPKEGDDKLFKFVP